MPITEKNKYALIDQMNVARTKGTRLVLSLKFARKDQDAKAAKEKINLLGRKIDDLLAMLMQDWSGTGKSLLEVMKKSNSALQGDIRDIKKKKNIAQKTVDALGRLDDIIGMASGLLK